MRAERVTWIGQAVLVDRARRRRRDRSTDWASGDGDSAPAPSRLDPQGQPADQEDDFLRLLPLNRYWATFWKGRLFCGGDRRR